MKITNVSVKINNRTKGKVKAIAHMLIDNCFAVKDIRIIYMPSKELLIAMPSKKTFDGRYTDIVHPINQETRKAIIDRILEKFYNELLEMLNQSIQLPSQYYFEINTSDIQKISVYSDKTSEEFANFIVEDFCTETLEELQKEILDMIQKEEEV